MKKGDRDEIINIALCVAIVVIQIVACVWPEALVATMFVVLGPILLLEVL